MKIKSAEKECSGRKTAGRKRNLCADESVCARIDLCGMNAKIRYGSEKKHKKIGVTRFELATSRPPAERATKLRHTPMIFRPKEIPDGTSSSITDGEDFCKPQNFGFQKTKFQLSENPGQKDALIENRREIQRFRVISQKSRKNLMFPENPWLTTSGKSVILSLQLQKEMRR